MPPASKTAVNLRSFVTGVTRPYCEPELNWRFSSFFSKVYKIEILQPVYQQVAVKMGQVGLEILVFKYLP